MVIIFRAIGKFSPSVRSYRDKMTSAMGPEIERRMKAAKENPDGWDRPVCTYSNSSYLIHVISSHYIKKVIILIYISFI